jgi:hypothetical protein
MSQWVPNDGGEAFRGQSRNSLTDEFSGALVSSTKRIQRRLAQAPLQNFRSPVADLSAADPGGQVCARLFKPLLQRLGVTESAHQGQLFSS